MYYPKDWTKVEIDDSFKQLGKATWNDQAQTCTIYSSVLVKVVTGTQGFTENPQRYVVAVKKYAIPEMWRYPENLEETPEKEVDFNHFVTVQYADIDNSNENEQGIIMSTGLEFSTNMFYPIFIRMLGGVP